MFKCALPRRVRSFSSGLPWVAAVTAAVISPVIPPVLARDSGRVSGAPGVVSVAGRSLPLPLLVPRRTTALVYGLSALDDRVGFQNLVTCAEQQFHAARSYSLIKPPRTGRHLIRL